jgi:hypothetical protein
MRGDYHHSIINIITMVNAVRDNSLTVHLLK